MKGIGPGKSGERCTYCAEPSYSSIDGVAMCVVHYGEAWRAQHGAPVGVKSEIASSLDPAPRNDKGCAESRVRSLVDEAAERSNRKLTAILQVRRMLRGNGTIRDRLRRWSVWRRRMPMPDEPERLMAIVVEQDALIEMMVKMIGDADGR